MDSQPLCVYSKRSLVKEHKQIWRPLRITNFTHLFWKIEAQKYRPKTSSRRWIVAETRRAKIEKAKKLLVKLEKLPAQSKWQRSRRPTFSLFCDATSLVWIYCSAGLRQFRPALRLWTTDEGCGAGGRVRSGLSPPTVTVSCCVNRNAREW